ncbi:hypothetical protein CcaverHIS002_0311200 [Cutaneotrichosporon cavernicola]|uniref:Geranylgeranyl transferase type-2 subunit alpha n=1 Tax=Cutaneotrichosporon cavernicola TaxID=279322 RepID=A0AA48QV59_9TREE|nr:uncharacterized protein CcaverHIS019_0311060 [Cutaneotrichosporon cavernicola]BEI83252.1 hypothetical protein CcaverHIS002_0311200 [Cutaneotrichosporon cavernicola]BEI91036.1 hypothetical protein CcaverHIS019_0311060 [Cutaneotrichosporon cavernicola]BEJ06587.1 hypothetical protein CcaverHIS641_0311090 [Cutaneotrichosporon cavernicola]
MSVGRQIIISHGIKRTRLSKEAEQARRLKEVSKIQAYTELQEDVFAMKRGNEYTLEALEKTNKLLDLNPEFYTVWNYRRHILTRGLFPSSTDEEIVGLLEADLRLTMAYLRVHPKVYWIWTHRKWCLENVPRGPGDSEGWRNEFWKKEIGLVEKLLDADARNFHAWTYRRYINESLPESFTPKRTPADELKYTTKKIESNFSNFSAWHSRTKTLPKIWAGMSEDEVAVEKDKEFELVTQALWTDPGDQSGWLYHRWLVGTNPSFELLQRELESIKELHEAEPDSKWCMNALAHYHLLSARLPSAPTDEAAVHRADAKTILERLEVIDEDRKERYHELGEMPSPAISRIP